MATLEENSSGTFLVEFSTEQLRFDDPVTFFNGVTETLAAIQELDSNLLSLLSPDSQSSLVIQNIEVGSLRLWVATQLDGIPEKDLHNLDYKKILGHFLVKARTTFVKFLRREIKIERRDQIESLANTLETEARNAAKGNLKVRRVPRLLLVDIVVRVIRATQSLPAGEQVMLNLGGQDYLLPRDAEVTASAIQEIKMVEVEPFEQEMNLRVKRPDMLGQSQWEFLDQKHAVKAKILDTEWLCAYQKSTVSLKPGDSIAARVRVTPRPSADEPSYSYDVLKVHRVVSSTIAQQNLLPFTDGNGIGTEF